MDSKFKKVSMKLIIYILLVLGAILCLLPLLWMLSTSFKTNEVIFQIPPVWIPNEIAWKNYSKAVNSIPFWRYTLNTSIITFFRMLGELLTGALVGFGFARYDFKGKRILFMLLLATIMIPGEITMIPVFIMYRHIGWIDTFLPLTVGAFFGGSPVFIFFLRQYFMTIPRDFEEAARIDGYGELRIFWEIFLPISKPALAAIAIFSFQGSWNDLLGPLIYLNSYEKYTLQVGLTMFQSLNKVEWGPLMAASILVLLPVLILFFSAQKYFVEGITVTGIKG